LRWARRLTWPVLGREEEKLKDSRSYLVVPCTVSSLIRGLVNELYLVGNPNLDRMLNLEDLHTLVGRQVLSWEAIDAIMATVEWRERV
jgi:hypothetical protein